MTRLGFRPTHMALALLVVLTLTTATRAQDSKNKPVEFNRDIRPILSNNCFVCHGPDKNLRKAKLRLDTAEGAYADRGGYQAVVPGKPQDSELFRRITSKDPGERMPPPKVHKELSAKEVGLIRAWIEQGARYQGHWSLLAATRPPVPVVRDKLWPTNTIDHFVLARLEEEGLKPAPTADRRTLLRRLSFDLTGLPPSPAETDAFGKDTSPNAYEKVVDRLLASPHHGERMAQYWLDLVRYADTTGIHGDNHRDIAPFRDYVIQAFNANKRFDQFTVEQLAGDLLPNPNVAQKVASGYNHLLMTTAEGGAQAKEYLAKYFADRVRNTSVVWMGLTMGCAECHNHKFDPITAKDFYSYGAFFADLKETAVGMPEQVKLPSPMQEEQLAELNAAITPLQQLLNSPNKQVDDKQAKWEKELTAEAKQKLPKNVAAVVNLDPAKRNAKQKQELMTYFRGTLPELKGHRDNLADLQKQKDALLRDVPQTIISKSVMPRTIRVLPRGNWLDDSGEVVGPAVPAVFGELNVKDRRPTRLDLARWMVAPENPLTARVFVNRLWMLTFGQGIVKTLDDFGSQGAWPTHPELLDWLAVEFRESGWDVRRTLKSIVMSKAYQQSSQAGPELRQRDPYNQLLARQARFRLDAEMVRDNALAVSGLLVTKVGGRSVRPYQPPGYWKHLNFPQREYQNDKGEDLYRRGLYSYWCRTFLHPSLLAFDAPTREECTVERPRSNTPQQALVLLNDPIYVEAARVFAECVLRDGGKTADERIHYAYHLALGRQAQPKELNLLRALYQDHLEQFQRNPKGAEELLRVGDRPAAKDVPAAELAAWTSVTRVVLNLHETITRE